jgi:hypothetical protein
MCFGGGASPPQPKAPPVPPNERDGDQEATRRKVEAVKLSKQSGFDATNLTQGSMSDTSAPVSKPVLGA